MHQSGSGGFGLGGLCFGRWRRGASRPVEGHRRTLRSRGALIIHQPVGYPALYSPAAPIFPIMFTYAARVCVLAGSKISCNVAKSQGFFVMLIVVALGGNAVSLPGKEGNIADQFAATRTVCVPLADLILQGHRLLITHGNGPQVGNVMRRVEIAAASTTDRVYPLPLDIVVADTEAGMGYMIGQCLMNELASRKDWRIV